MLPRTACVWVLLLTSCGDSGSPALVTETLAPLLATMTPAEASSSVGDTVDFVVTVTGGLPSADAIWSRAVSETAVASVAATASGCRAIALSPGTATITAGVTRGNETRTASARLTVNEPVTRGCPPNSPTWMGLPLCEEYPRVGYERDAFGSGYSSLEDEIIAGLPQVDSAKVYTPYTCTLYDIHADGTAATDIEHIVALAEAYDSGLPESRFREFAADIDNLTIARPDVNRNQKSDRDAGEWRPARNQGWFVNRVVAVKQKYALSVDSSERDALKSMLDSDPSRTVTCGG